MAGHSSGGIIYKSFKWIKGLLTKYGGTDFFAVLTLILFVYYGLGHTVIFFQTFAFFFALIPIVLPFFLLSLFKYSWMAYIREDKYWNRREYVVLEIKLPEDLVQTPYSMELVLRSMYQTGEIDTPIDEFWNGHVKPWFSLEIVSTEGIVKFYIWTWKHYKDLIESQLYAHYPQIQVFEVPDYTLGVPFNPETDDYDVWGIEQQLQKPDPYPIMTYVESGLDKRDLDEEFKTDPLVSVLEFMGSIGPGEHVWMQMIVRAHTVCPWAQDKLHHTATIEEWAKEETEGILAKTITDPLTDKANFTRLTEAEKEAIKAMGLKLNKQVFDVGIRQIYLSKKGFRKGRNSGLPTTMRSFEHGSDGRGLNGFKPVFVIGPFNYPWEDYFGMRKKAKKKKMFDGYVRRQIFYPPYGKKWIALNIEEIATVFHFPGKVASTPTLLRMPSKRGEAPSNLPV